jgi:hypothetical protein
MAGTKGGKREAAVAALLEEPTVQKAAARAGVGYRTLKQWLAEDREFQELYARARRQLLQHAVGRLQRACGKAVSRLVRALGAGKDADAIRAATAILDRAVSGAELLDVLERLEALEVAAKKRGKVGG